MLLMLIAMMMLMLMMMTMMIMILNIIHDDAPDCDFNNWFWGLSDC